MLQIQEISLPITHSDNKLQKTIAEILGLEFNEVKNFTITKRAIDSRKKREMIFFVYSVTVELENEQTVIKSKEVKKNKKHHRIDIVELYTYKIPFVKDGKNTKRPVIVGTGPAGMFSALVLAKAGLNPLVIERGGDVDTRIKDVETFMNTGKLNTESNIQFGEGGAGTFSDGKLNTLITNPRIKYIFEELVKAGAPDAILWNAKPHIGTDKIRRVAKNIRKQIIDLGGEVRFNTLLTDIKIKDKKITDIILNDKEEIKTDTLVLAIGYSARDTYEMLYKRKLNLEQKSFSIGVRIEHKTEMINKSQYDKFYNNKKLGMARYKLVYHSKKNRSVYTFCMCPGGYVMPSTSEDGYVITNGMSEYAQDGENSNSALLVNVEKNDFMSDHPLAGIEFQKKWEKKAFELGENNFHAPVQLVGDFLKKQKSDKIRSVKPTYKPGITLAPLDDCLPDFVVASLREALPKMDMKIRGFAHEDAVLTGIETRSSSPLRITRNKDTLQSNIAGIYPAGEGAGYAGGIVSSAVDGMRVGEMIIDIT
ncbi:MAG: hypothetical protein COX81_02355 [Candidatus Magasanikbacteria bacterium CG_4_10_14_0_2_um_filter_37_12]|uniref:FAD-dependent protein C-terminal domain-containing protein n=1 Tax=Candidatus Magasanikbacteria bacterium CG_4_10_14_0_2_um_filter_37_12 TaxID=1974637 RepID=A0A2M7V7X3_9BACT|nr:MAG: hypothetical protein COX81_02355 [Candidatus Magasanikbacteria bacterium CG_4_10_14_0_2_um_filter_37_12]